MIIDTHVHTGNMLGFEMKEDDIIYAMNRYGIDHCLVSSINAAEFTHKLRPIPAKYQHSQLECLNDVVSFAKKYPSKISAAIWVKPFGEKADYDLYKAINDNRKYIKAIKFHPYHSNLPFDGKETYPFIELAQHYGLPVVVHTGGSDAASCSRVYNVAKRFPKTNFVMVHMGLGTDNSEAIRITVEVEQEIVKWVGATKGFYKKISGGRYIAVMEERDIKRFIDEKFKILDDIRTIKINDRLYATVSIGIGRGGSTFKENELWARQALDMALGRGGDQAAIKKNDSYKFFGGVSKGVEKRDKVKTRVIAATLTNHINNSSNVIIMGHRFSDLDSVGSCIGMWSAVVKGLNKNAYILINRQQTLAKSLVSCFEKAGFDSIFKSEDEALDLLDEHSLLIIVDTHNPNFVESKEIYERCERVVVIDHHRMMVNHIDKALVFFHEPYASSASEMTAELVQYLGHNSLSRLESEALLSGIMLDTKNFVLRTGVRTFEAAAFLKSNGADTVEVKRLFSNSIDTYKVKYKLVSDAEIFNYCAIASADEDIPDIRIASAQAADELLGIESVKASFVIYKTGKTVNISARSLGDMNVQVVMEQLGGGGHQTMAACQLENTSIAEARERLVSIISELDVNRDEAG